MRTTRILLAALLALTAPALAAAVDAPHDQLNPAANCQACHQLHTAVGNSLTKQATISDACLTCHTDSASPSNRLGFPWVSGDQAVRAASGAHHRWDAVAINGAAGATTPSDPEMAKRLIDGSLECSVCHNPHSAGKALAPASSMYVSYQTGTAYDEVNTGGGTGQLTIQSVGAAALAKSYRVRIVSVGNVAVSNDGGVSWFRPTTTDGTTWAADPTPTGGAYVAGNSLAMNDPAVVVRLNGVPLAGDVWTFYVSFPFLRALNTADEVCLACHQERNVQAGHIRQNLTGSALMSHPVGETLGSNGRAYDRATPLDVDGGVQGAGDANATNDLVLGAGGKVGCTSCHAPHNADSNSITVDQR